MAGMTEDTLLSRAVDLSQYSPSYRVFDTTLPTTPQGRLRRHDHATLLVSWWCTGFALVIILVRLFGRYSRLNRLFREDKIMAWSIIPLLVRMALIHVVLLYGTNNHLPSRELHLDAQALHERAIGSRLVLPARIIYAMFIWLAKFTISEFLKRLTEAGGLWTTNYEFGLRIIRIFLVGTFAAVVVATLAECHPFDNYWQVLPNPGRSCTSGYAQLITMGSCDIITDIALIAFPIPIIVKSSMPMARKISLCLLFSLSTILVAVTAYRMAAIFHVDGRQQLRSLWASLEILAAAAVSNALTLGSFIRDRGVKKAKYKGNMSRTDSVDQPSINRTMTRQHWGSDEDLFRTLGCRLGSVTEDHVYSSSKAPPLHNFNLHNIHDPDQDVSKTWFSNASSHDDSGSDGNVSPTTERRRPRPSSSAYRPQSPVDSARFRDMTLFDVGGTLEGGHNAPSPSSTTLAHDFAASSRRPSSGMTGPPPRYDFNTPSRNPRQRERLSTPVNESSVPGVGRSQEMSISDPGGLLS